MQKMRANSKKIFTNLGFSVLAILLAFFIGGVLIALVGESPLKAYGTMFGGAFGTPKAIANTISKSVPLMFTGLAVAVGSRSGVFNIGAEGQVHMGAMAAALIGFLLPSLPAPLLLILVFAGGLGASMAFGAIPGWFKAKLGTSEVIVCIMMNYIGILFTSYLCNYPFKEEGGISQTPFIAERIQFGALTKGSQLTATIFIALATALFLYWFMWKTRAGFELRAVGENPSAARSAGINPTSKTIQAMALSGGVAGLAGICEVVGRYNRFVEGFSPSFGFTGIAVAILGQNHPAGVILTALLFGAMDAGALKMSRVTDISSKMVMVIQGLVVIFVAAPHMFRFLSSIRGKEKA